LIVTNLPKIWSITNPVRFGLAAMAITVVWAGTGAQSRAAAWRPINNTRPASSNQVQGIKRHQSSRIGTRLFGSSVVSNSQVFTGRRDPFRLPPPPAKNAQSAADGNRLPAYLPPGNRGLIIGQLTLKGVLSEDSGQTMIAIVSNKTQRAYFLRQNEAVYDGAVIRITPEAIYFSERTTNSKGESIFRPVVKRLTVSQGEAQ
jgi:hypothetical protein